MNSELIKIKVTGMHCSSCEKLIDGALAEVPGVKESKIDSTSGECRIVTNGPLDIETVLKKIVELGFGGILQLSIKL